MNISDFVKELDKLKINYSEEQLSQLERYYQLLIEYNKVMNLTGITEKDSVYLKHFYDSLTLAKVVDLNNVNTLCDIGSGAGFPGIVIKIFYPNLNVMLVDSLNKRINFLKIVIEQLGLDKISACHSRIEDFARINRESYDIVTARAVAPLNILLEYSIPMLKNNAYFIAMKGKEEDLSIYENALNILNSKISQIEKFKLPYENSNRTIYKILKNKKNSDKYPRKYLDIKKNPL